MLVFENELDIAIRAETASKKRKIEDAFRSSNDQELLHQTHHPCDDEQAQHLQLVDLLNAELLDSGLLIHTMGSRGLFIFRSAENIFENWVTNHNGRPHMLSTTFIRPGHSESALFRKGYSILLSLNDKKSVTHFASARDANFPNPDRVPDMEDPFRIWQAWNKAYVNCAYQEHLETPFANILRKLGLRNFEYFEQEDTQIVLKEIYNPETMNEVVQTFDISQIVGVGFWKDEGRASAAAMHDKLLSIGISPPFVRISLSESRKIEGFYAANKESTKRRKKNWKKNPHPCPIS